MPPITTSFHPPSKLRGIHEFSNKDVVEGSKFCGSCGASMTCTCAVCASQNPLGNKFCSTCGASLGSAQLGLALDRALVWHDLFERMGWWTPLSDVPVNNKKEEYIRNTFFSEVQKGGLPMPEDRFEPYIFWVRVDTTAVWNISTITLNEKVFKRTWSSEPEFVVATRCRIFTVSTDTKDPKLFSCLFKDIDGIEIKEYNIVLARFVNIIIQTSLKDTLTLSVPVKGSRFIDKAMLFAHGAGVVKDEGSHVIASSNIDTAHSNKGEFIAVITEFFRECWRSSASSKSVVFKEQELPRTEVNQETSEQPMTLYKCRNCGYKSKSQQRNCPACGSSAFSK